MLPPPCHTVSLGLVVTRLFLPFLTDFISSGSGSLGQITETWTQFGFFGQEMDSKLESKAVFRPFSTAGDAEHPLVVPRLAVGRVFYMFVAVLQKDDLKYIAMCFLLGMSGYNQDLLSSVRNYFALKAPHLDESQLQHPHHKRHDWLSRHFCRLPSSLNRFCCTFLSKTTET